MSIYVGKDTAQNISLNLKHGSLLYSLLKHQQDVHVTRTIKIRRPCCHVVSQAV